MSPESGIVKTSTRGVVLLSAVLSLMISGTVFAQEEGDEPPPEEQEPVMEEIVVTAQKREERIQDVPFSIAAQTQEALRKSGAENMEDIARNVAGFTVQDLGPGQSQVAIRGVSAGQIVRDQPGVKEQVGVYLDESVISLSLFTPDLELVDLNRVEVLRGPQGTLFGSGSLSGTVRYITNQPQLGVTEAESFVEGNMVDDDANGGAFQGVFNAPLGDNAAVRAVSYFRRMGGFMNAVQPDNSVNEDVNDGRKGGGRVAIRWEPTENLTVTPRFTYQETQIDGFNRIDVYNILGNPFTTEREPVQLGGRRQFTQLEETFSDEFFLFDNTLEYLWGDLLLTSITTWTERNILQVRDATQLTGSITGGTIGFGPEVFTLDAPLFDRTDVEMLTQEFRLTNDPANRFQWVLGAFYNDMKRDYGQRLPVDGFTAITEIPTEGPLAPTDTLFWSQIPYDFEQFALFGEATYSLTDRLDLTAGARYYDYEEDRVLNFDGIFAATTVGEPGSTSTDGVTPRFMAEYLVNDNVTLNAQASKGFRLGGINDPLNEPLCSPQDLETFGDQPTWDDETLWNYEVGAKTSFMEGRGTFNIAAFYMDIKDLQVTTTAGTCSSRIIFNVPDSRSAGIEAELFMQPTPNFEFGLSGSYVDAELQSTITSTDEEGVTTIVAGIEEGNRLPTTPEFQFAASATYTWPMASGREGFVTGTFQHVGERWTQISDQSEGFGTVDLTAFPLYSPSADTFTFDPELPDYQIGNIRVGVRSDSWEATVFVNNIWDERARLALDQERGTLARVGFLTNQPRTVGVTLRNFF